MLMGLLWTTAPWVSAHQKHSNVTWKASVQPIFERRCTGCHTSDGFGPMPLETYDQARQWGAAIKQQVLEGRCRRGRPPADSAISRTTVR